MTAVSALHPSQSVRPIGSDERNANYDLIRVTACLAVILLHVSARPLYMYMNGDVGHATWFVTLLISSLTHWSVPVFVMLSGALILARQEPWEVVLFRRVPRLLLVLCAASALYALWRIYFAGGLTIAEFITGIADTRLYYHLYYLYVAIGLYLLAPVIKKLIQGLDASTLRLAAVVACAISAIVFASGSFQRNYSRDAVTISLDYIGYFVLGYYLATYRPRLPYVVLIVCGYFSTFLFVEAACLIFGASWPWTLYSMTYFSPMTYCAAIGVFGTLLAVPLTEQAADFLKRISPLTLIVYIVHPIFLETTRYALARLSTYLAAPLVDLPITYVSTTLFSFSAAYLLRQSSLVRKVF
jgi:surface polysaccharide O-acyltransferase-like enzyme